MPEIIHADIFFFTTTIVVVILAIVAIIVSLYVVSILNDIKYISKRIREGSDEVLEDIKVLREHIMAEGFKIGTMTKLFRKFFKRGRK